MFLLPLTVATNPLFPWKTLTLVKKMCFKRPQFQQVQDGRLFLELSARFCCTVQFCVRTGCSLSKQHPNYSNNLLETESLVMFAHLILGAFHVDAQGVALHHLNTHPKRRTGILCANKSFHSLISDKLRIICWL